MAMQVNVNKAKKKKDNNINNIRIIINTIQNIIL